MNKLFQTHFSIGCISNVILCIILASLYVGSLYIWGKTEKRNRPSTIKKRSLSVFLMSFVSALFVYIFADREYFGHDINFASLLGLRLSGLLPAVVLPLSLTIILFMGPVLLQYNDGMFINFFDWRLWYYYITNVLWLRNHVVAPFFEEFTFRACMLPILVPCFGIKTSVILCPFFFGIAHIHHVIEKLAYGAKFKVALMQSLFQCVYTTIFGAYSTFLFLQTGHVSAPFIAHAFCNFMGFPDFIQLVELEQPKRTILIMFFVIGLVLWMILLVPMTDPTIYDNKIYLPHLSE